MSNTCDILLINIIRFYQKRISSKKGYCCAHRAYHRESSCSEYIKNTIIEKGFKRSIHSIYLRFTECKEAYFAIKEIKDEQNSSAKKRSGRFLGWSNMSDSQKKWCWTLQAAECASCYALPCMIFS